MPMIVPAVAAAVTWVSSAAAAATAALAGAIATTGISATLSTSIAAGTLKLAATALGSLALNAVLAPRVGSAGSPVSFKADPSSPIRGVMGYFGTGGTQAHMRVWGKNNLMISYMVILSLGPIQGISKFEANELQVNFPLPNGEAARVEPYRDKMWMTYKMGLPTDGALSPPPNGGNPRMEWDGNHRTSGYAAAFWTMQNNSKKASYESGVPKPLWSLQGQLLYDPRFDSTQTAIGGSGQQRLNDWRTWGYSENPQVHAFNWALGHHKKLEDGSIDRKFLLAGVGARPDQIDLTTMVAGMNVSDANGWKISGEWNSQDDKWQTFAAMLQAGGSSPIHVGAKIGIMTNAPKVPVATITSADVIGNMNIKVMASRRDRFNTVYPRYLNELQNWDYSTAGAVTSTVYTDQDGGEERPKELTYNYVRLSRQAGQLAAYDLANTRESLKLAFPAKPYLVGIKPGDAVLVNDEAKGLVNQKFIVTARPIELMEGTIGFELRSETDSKHPWALGQVDRPAPSPALSPINPAPSVPADESWTVLPQPPSDGVSQPGFVVVGEVPDGIGSVLIQVGPSEEGPWSDAYNGPPTTESFKINGNDPGKQYWVKIFYYSVKGYPSDPLIKGPYTAPVLVSGDTKSVAGIPASTLTGRLVNVEGIAAQNASAVADLETVYGDTASSAANAAQVAADKAAVIQAKADAIIAKDGAVSARADAILAKADAISAKQDSVAASGASATSASQAGGFKTAAEAAAAVSTSQKLEAVAALNAMGRQNLVARENVTNPADLFSVTTGGTSGWGFSMAGSGANVTRSIKVGPLKVNTAYSISFKARRTSGSGSLLLDVDLFPDTLPGRTFDIQSSALTEFKWENITSASADMALSTVMLRFFRAPLPAGYAYEITDIKLEEGATATAWTPSPKDAATSAKAAAQSASQAFASETAAGQQASAASQDRQAAQTARGEAQGFRDQSSAAASTASGAAATATEQAGLAATARGEAQGFAGSALEYRNQASSFKTAAEAAAAVATSQKLEAVAALNAMGRQNLVARQNVTAGQAVTFGAGSLSGWGFSMVGTGTGSQERSITVGPLKRNTAYSVSILARRLAGSGSAPITCDFSPYLPERTFDIQANAWTRFTWENITSASADMELSTVRLRFFRPNMATGLNVEITDIKLEEGSTATAWTPSAKDAPYSASAAATSAASAAASETASGQNASATQADRIAAQTARGQAEGFRNQAVQASGDATAQASIATAQAGLSSGSATLAGQKADAASGSAALASTKADEAGASAAASRADQISAGAARDQALAALMAQGRQNLVARQNVTAGQAVTFGAGSLSGWGFSMVGTGTGSQERSITVGPLKRNTAYSVSILARRLAGSGSAPITCDFFPDTLPERTFDVQANAWTRFTWEGVTSASADMELSTVRLRFFRPNMAAGLNVEITDIKLEEGATATAWTPSAKDAPYSASAAATSAASAAASDTAAGQKAAAAEGSATTAATRAGEALTYRNQASSAASDAAGYAATASLASGTSVSARDQSVAAKDQAVGAKEDAQAAAATAIQQKSEATAAAAAASISANLAASVSASRNQLLYNSTGARGMDGWVGGPNWSTQDFGYGFGRGFNCAVSGSYLYNDNAHFAEIAPESWVTWSADPKIFGGTCDIWFEFYDSSFNRVGGNYAGRQVANRDFGDTVSGEALAPANAFNARLVIWPNFSAGGSAGVRRMKVERGRLPATAWSDEGTTEALAASLSVTAAVAADAQTRLSTVRFDVTGGAGGDPFQIWALADTSGSAAGLIATELSLSNVVGGSVVPALKLADGRAVFGAPVSIIKNGRRTTMGPGFGVGSSLHFWSGPNTIGFGSETVDNGLLGISDTDGFFGGRTINGPFDSGAASATVITVTTAWTTVATVASKDVGPTGSFLFRADWRATLSPKSPPPEAPAYGLNWRMVSTNLAGGDLRVIDTGYVDGNAGVANTIMAVLYRLVEGHSSPRAPRRLLLQLAMSGADDTQAASAHSARLQGVYYQT